MDKAAAEKKKAVNPAEKAAAAAQAALAKKEKEFAQHQADADKAGAARDKAEKDARDAIPVVIPPPEEDPGAARKAANDCIAELAALISAQADAMKALASLGALKKDTVTGEDPNTYDSDLSDWAKAVDEANDLFDKLPPGIEYAGPVGEAIDTYAGAAQSVLDAVRAGIGLWSGLKYTGQIRLAPTAGVTADAAKTKQYLKDQGLAESDKEAGDILKQMEKYTDTSSVGGPKGFAAALADKKKKCDEMVAKAEALEKKAAGK
jgi:hypothetical protein